MVRTGARHILAVPRRSNFRCALLLDLFVSLVGTGKQLLTTGPDPGRSGRIAAVGVGLAAILLGGLALAALCQFPKTPMQLDGDDGYALARIRANLRTIDNVKTMWAAEHRADSNAIPSPVELAPYFNMKLFPQSVRDERYRVGRIDEQPTAVLTVKILQYRAGTTVTIDDP